jgi:hypothetical protein
MSLRNLVRLVVFCVVLVGHYLGGLTSWRVHIGEIPRTPLFAAGAWEWLSFPLFDVVPHRIQHVYFRETLVANSFLWALATAWLLDFVLPVRRRSRAPLPAPVRRPAGTHGGGDTPPASAAPGPPARPARVAAPRVGAQTFGGGRYEALEPLGSGGFGTVYRARDHTRGLDVAVKTIDTAAIAAHELPNFREAFQREAATAGRLDHPGIVPVFDHNAQAERPYIVMSLVTGGTLRERLDREADQRLAWPEVRALGLQVAAALDYARQHGVRAHRDIKPANIFCTETGYKVGDFGVARPQRAAAGGARTLLAGVGTPGYMAPEQFLAPATVDWRADLFALCVVLYEALTGKRPFRGVRVDAGPEEDPGGLREIVQAAYAPPPPLRSLAPQTPAALAAAIECGLQFDRVKRYASWDDFQAALRAADTSGDHSS